MVRIDFLFCTLHDRIGCNSFFFFSGLHEKGLFRVPGFMAQVKEIKAAFDKGLFYVFFMFFFVFLIFGIVR